MIQPQPLWIEGTNWPPVVTQADLAEAAKLPQCALCKSRRCEGCHYPPTNCPCWYAHRDHWQELPTALQPKGW